MKNKDYYWCYMNNGGVCVKLFTFEEIDDAIVCGRYRDAKRIKTITPDKVKLKVPRIRGRIKSKGYYQSYVTSLKEVLRDFADNSSPLVGHMLTTI